MLPNDTKKMSVHVMMLHSFYLFIYLFIMYRQPALILQYSILTTQHLLMLDIHIIILSQRKSQ
jgi:hypothetical protein